MLDDTHISAVFRLGLFRGFIQRAHLIEFADREIERRKNPPPWILDLAMSQHTNILDLISLLTCQAEGADSTEVIKSAFALLPLMNDSDFDECRLLSREIYSAARDALETEWGHPVMCAAIALDDEFDLVEGAISAQSRGQIMQQLDDFIKEFRNPDIRQQLAPAHWVMGGRAIH
jgi:hypothetical protein